MPYRELKHEALTKSIIGCAMNVHRYLGPGFPEVIYKRCLGIELKKQQLKHESEVARDIHYHGICVGLRRLDLLVENLVLVELKATAEIKSGDHTQIINLLKIFEIEVGLLINFGKPSLEFKRFAN